MRATHQREKEEIVHRCSMAEVEESDSITRLQRGEASSEVWIHCDGMGRYCPTPDSCYNRFESIPSAMYFTLLNLLGEDPVLGYHSFDGRVIVTPRNRAEEGNHCRSP